MAPFLNLVERKLGVVQALAKGECGGSYSDACILTSGIVSGIAADLWPGEGIDKKRFVEVWARHADPAVSPSLISTPLLVDRLRRDGRVREAATIEALRPLAFGPGYQTRVVTSADVDMLEHEIRAVCPQLVPSNVRAYSYPAVFYRHVRSALVHEYHLGDEATTWPMIERETSVSYANIVDWKDQSRQFRQIHYHIPWLLEVVRSIAASTQTVLESAPLPHPSPWWIEG